MRIINGLFMAGLGGWDDARLKKRAFKDIFSSLCLFQNTGMSSECFSALIHGDFALAYSLPSVTMKEHHD